MQTTDVRDAAKNAVGQSKSFLGKQVDDRSTKIGRQIEAVAQDLRNVGQQLGETGAIGPVAGLVNQGADAVEQFGKYLEDADSTRLIGDLEQIARRQLWAVTAGALVLGFTASRFLKTSSARRYRESDFGAGYGSQTRRYGGSSYGVQSTYGSDSYGGDSYGDTAYGSPGSSRYGETSFDDVNSFESGRGGGSGRYAT